ncbi:glycosyltransferase family 39 protein [Dactylosporangium vinaceum]|uniref:ArnT family glycosyltransferase n=1 Tax=Dactylosporangium vinaceum TaxID=53362 RepID=A0ABV5MIG1_9ACTN|nr:glycosyltransferase family 39 protein [Dactylosporangium vinaceum]UAB97599.1 glycosyltransferase family 39 protein [Dactylosporangium vinaceum]
MTIKIGTGRSSTIAATAAVVAAVTCARANAAPVTVDEGTYTAQATAVLRGRLAPYTYFYDHPPLGWLQAAPAVALQHLLHLPGSAIAAVRIIVAMAVFADAVLVYALCRRLSLPPWPAAIAGVWFACSPLTTSLLHHVYLEAFAVPWILAAFLAGIGARPGWRAIAAGMLLGVAALSKESALLFVPALVALVAASCPQLLRRRAIMHLAGGLTGVLVLYPLFAALRGELFVFVRTAGWQLIGRQGSGVLWDTHSGRFTAVASWTTADPLLVTLGLAAGIALAMTKDRRWLGLAVLVPTMIVVKPGGYLPGMFAAVLVPFLALAAALGGWLLWQRVSRRAWVRVAAVAVATLVVAGCSVRVAATGQGDGTARGLAIARWVEANVPRSSGVLVDDELFAQLYADGRDPWREVILVEKLDFDRTASARWPGGWQHVDVVVLSPRLRRQVGLTQAVQAQRAVAAGVVVGRPAADVLVLRVCHVCGDATGSYEGSETHTVRPGR